MAEDKKKPERWVPGKISFAYIEPNPLPLPAYYNHRDKDVSMGCKVPDTSCPACDAGIPVKTMKIDGRKKGSYPISNIDYEQLELRISAALGLLKGMFDSHTKGLISDRTLLGQAGFKLEGPDGRELQPMPTMHTHDHAEFLIPEVGDQMVGVDWGTDEKAVMVMGVVKKFNEPNANGDVFLPPGEVFMLSEPEFVGPFPDQRKIYRVDNNWDAIVAEHPEVQKINKQQRELHRKLCELQAWGPSKAGEADDLYRLIQNLYRDRQGVEELVFQ